MNAEQSSFGGVVPLLNVSRLVGIKEIITGMVFSKSRFNDTFDHFRYKRKISNRTIVLHLDKYILQTPTISSITRGHRSSNVSTAEKINLKSMHINDRDI